MSSLILGVMGKKRAGKDTFAARLVSEHGFTRIGFADALKDVALDLSPIVRSEPPLLRADGYLASPVRLRDLVGRVGWEQAKAEPEVRRLLQRLGVAVRDHIGEDTWVDAALTKAAKIGGPVVITDVRFPNEADRICAVGGRLVRVARPGQVSDDTHISETALDDRIPDIYVTNDGTVTDLHTRADVVADLLFGPAS